jgi:two-component system, OmpR family, sensor histidine kinase VicK
MMIVNHITKQSLLTVVAALGNMSADGFFVYSKSEKKVEYANEAVLKLFDISHATFGSQPQFYLSHILPEEFEYLKNEFEKFLENNKIENLEFRARSHDGAIRNLTMNAYVLQGGDFIVGVIRDITQTREHENYIINYGAKKNTLLDIVTHNLSGPLLISKNIIESLDKLIDQNDIRKIHSHVQVIRENTSHCIEVINEFLEEEHLVSETIYTKANRFDVVDKLNSILERFRTGYKDHLFAFHVASPNGSISNDDVKFLQVMNNLVSNAVKWSPAGSTVQLRLEELEEEILITVKDSGVGIPKKIQPFVFQRSSIASRPGLKGEKSIGMGLYIAKKLVALMQGDLWFESEEGVGTSMFLKVPKDLRLEK